MARDFIAGVKLTDKAMRQIGEEEASELLDDIFSMCAKLLHDRDVGTGALMSDLVELRDNINSVRAAVAGGAGYKVFGGRIKRD